MRGFDTALRAYATSELLLRALRCHRRGIGVEVRAGAEGLERVIQFVYKRYAGGDVDLRDVGVANAVEVLDERT